MNMRINRSIAIGIGVLLLICMAAALVAAGWTGLTSTATYMVYDNDDGTLTQIVCVDGIITVTTGTWEELEETPLNSPPAGILIPFLQSRSSSIVSENDDGSLTQITCVNGIITVTTMEDTTMEEMFAARGETPF